ncbi:MAG: hypothetical protein U0Y10_19750 [Spirosomataceae bacterium]
MKKFLLYRLFNFLMAIVVLSTSTGFGLVEHSCMIRGKTYSLSSAHQGCKHCPTTPANNASNEQLKKQSCCDEKTTYEHVDYSSSLVELGAKFVKTISEAVANVVHWVVERLVEAISTTSSSLTASAAPFSHSGRDILAFHQTFLI